MLKLLLVAYYFPPDGGAGTQRPAKFCRFLPDLGWDVTVVTRTAALRRGRWDPEDLSLLSDIDGRVNIVRVEEQTRGSGHRWSLKVAAPAWLQPARQAVSTIVVREHIDCVLITMSPFWLNRLGRCLQAETGVPVVYDLRDPWSLDGWQPQRSYWHWQREMKTMRHTLEAADGVIANTPEAALRIGAACPQLAADRLTVITNGYDADDFRASSFEPSDRNSTAQFSLVHCGTLHGEVDVASRGLRATLKRALRYSPETIVPSGRTVVHLLNAVDRLRRLNHPAVDRLRIILVGQLDSGTRLAVHQAECRELVESTGFVTHAASVEWLERADALFLPLHDLPPGQRSLIVPGKAYEYLASGKPILGCLPEGDVRDLVAASGRGYLSSPTDEEQIAETLGTMLSQWSAGSLPVGRPVAWVRSYERRQLATRLDSFLRKIRERRTTAKALP